jgi:serine/threonine protein kinase
VLIKNEYSEKADVWSLGAILYEILVGEGYDEGKEVTQAMVDIRKQGLPFPRDITFNAQYLVKDMMCINPDDRLGTKDIIKRLPIQQERKQIKPIRPRNVATLDIKDTNEQHESIGTITSTTEEKYTLCTGKIEKHMP